MTFSEMCKRGKKGTTGPPPQQPPFSSTSLLVLVNNNGCKAAYLFLRVLPRGNCLGSIQFSQISTHEVIRVILLTCPSVAFLSLFFGLVVSPQSRAHFAVAVHQHQEWNKEIWHWIPDNISLEKKEWRQHIFPNVKVTSNQNVHNFWLHFLAWFFMPFHMVGFILLRVLALKTNSIEASDWLLEEFPRLESGFWG